MGKLESNNKTNAIGDNGKAIGIYQIHKICWLDVKDKIGGNYTNCFEAKYAKKVVFYYLNRYEPNGNLESWARLWNSGPNWRNKKQLTNKYWQKFQKISLTLSNK